MHRITSLLTLLCLLLTLTACGDTDSAVEAGQANVSNVSSNGVGDSTADARRGEARPEWSLEDFQPNSPRFETRYGLEAFDGDVTLIALFAGWCGYCRGQAVHLETLQKELEDEGYSVNVLAINAVNANEQSYRDALVYVLDDDGNITQDENGEPIYRCTYPMFQDTDDVNAWALHQGSKDDFFIYDADGELWRWLPISGDVDTNLGDPINFANFKALLIEAIGDNSE